MALPRLAHLSPLASSNLAVSRLLMICEAETSELGDDEAGWTGGGGGGGGDEDSDDELWPSVPTGFEVRCGSVKLDAAATGAEQMALSSFRMPSRMRISRSILLLSSSFCQKPTRLRPQQPETSPHPLFGPLPTGR